MNCFIFHFTAGKVWLIICCVLLVLLLLGGVLAVILVFTVGKGTDQNDTDESVGTVNPNTTAEVTTTTTSSTATTTTGNYPLLKSLFFFATPTSEFLACVDSCHICPGSSYVGSCKDIIWVSSNTLNANCALNDGTGLNFQATSYTFQPNERCVIGNSNGNLHCNSNC